MDKQEFITALRARLAGLPERELEDRLGFYIEMIDDRMEEGSTEQDAVAQIGTVEQIAAEILGDIPLAALAKQRIKPRRKLKAVEIVLLAVGSPIWVSLLIAAFAVVLALYVSWWSVIVSLWASFASFAAAALAGSVAGPLLCIWQGEGYGLLVIAGALASAGLAIFSFFGCREATRGTLRLTRSMVLGLKKAFLRREDAQ